MPLPSWSSRRHQPRQSLAWVEPQCLDAVAQGQNNRGSAANQSGDDQGAESPCRTGCVA